MVLPCRREIIKIHMNYNKLAKLFSAVLLAALCAGSVQAQTNLVHWSNTPGPGGTEGPGTGTGLDGAYATYQLTSFGHYIVTLSNLNTVVTSGYKFTDFVLTFTGTSLIPQTWNDGFVNATGSVSGNTETVDFSSDLANLAFQPTVVFTASGGIYNNEGMSQMTVNSVEATPEPGIFALLGVGLTFGCAGRKYLARNQAA